MVLRILLVLTALLGLAREWKAHTVTQDIRAGLTGPVDGTMLEQINARVGRHFVEGSGVARQHSRPLILRTAADRLWEGGGQCGDAVLAMAAVLDVMDVPFRILQLDVRANGANHVLLEAKSDDGKWLLFDPLRQTAFRHPQSAALLTLEEARALPLHQRLVMDPLYVTRWPLTAPVRRTSWAPVESTWRGRAWMLEPGFEVAALSLGLLFIRRGARQWRAGSCWSSQ